MPRSRTGLALELLHSFRVPGAPDAVLDLLLDVERIAPCLPGAHLTGRNGDRCEGDFELKLGAHDVAYRGELVWTSVDRRSRKATLTARGKGLGATGTGVAEIVASVEPVDAASLVTIVTDLHVDGLAAASGRGILTVVVERLVEQFACNVERILLDSVDATPTTTSVATAEAGPLREHTPSDPGLEVDEKLDRLDRLAVVAPVAVRWGLPLVAALVLGVLLARRFGGAGSAS